MGGIFSPNRAFRPLPSAKSLMALPVACAFTAVISLGCTPAASRAFCMHTLANSPLSSLPVTLVVSHIFAEPRYSKSPSRTFSFESTTAEQSSPSVIPSLFLSNGLILPFVSSCNDSNPQSVRLLYSSKPTIRAFLILPRRIIEAAEARAFALEVHAVFIVYLFVFMPNSSAIFFATMSYPAALK